MLSTTPVKKFMTPSPHVVQNDMPLEKVSALMHRHGIRHLPVIDDHQKLVGLVSHGDVEFASLSENFFQLPVSAVMSTDPYIVHGEIPVKEVIRKMVSRKLGSALVVDPQGNVTGIFTAIDGLKLIEEMA